MRETGSLLPPKGVTLLPPGRLDTNRSLYQRWFGPVNEGSLRLVVINIVLCGTTGTFFVYPYFLKCFGFYVGLGLLVGCVLLTYLTSRVIFTAAERYNQIDYLILIRDVLGQHAYNVGKATYFCDYFVTYVAGLLIAWNNWQYLLYNYGFLNDSMRTSNTELEFQMYHPTVLFWRTIFIWGTFVLLLPLFSRKNMDGLKYVFFSFSLGFVITVIYIFFDLAEFREHYRTQAELVVYMWKPFDVRTLQVALIFLAAFYVQPNLLTMKRDLANPTARRLNKTLNVSHIIFLIFGVLFAAYGYYCLGDVHTSYMFTLRQSFEGKRHEWMYHVLMVWATLNAMIYLSFFNLSFRNYINSLTENHLNPHLVNLGPFFAAAFLSWVYPNIVKILGLNGIFVCLVNGFVFPTLFKRRLDIQDGCGVLKRTFWSTQILLYAALAVLSFWQIIFGESL